mmetsp:Transcript_19088/g.21839  ORF Transcript_19088/g.21839 Transcript_19088/m.21839 type:complete len:101 (+) Transcript_19088:73-375(+)
MKGTIASNFPSEVESQQVSLRSLRSLFDDENEGDKCTMDMNEKRMLEYIESNEVANATHSLCGEPVMEMYLSCQSSLDDKPNISTIPIKKTFSQFLIRRT